MFTLGTEMFAQGGLYMNAYVTESGNEEGSEATFTNISIFESYDMKIL